MQVNPEVSNSLDAITELQACIHNISCGPCMQVPHIFSMADLFALTFFLHFDAGFHHFHLTSLKLCSVLFFFNYYCIC